MTAKHEITRKFALAYAGALKRDKSRLLDEVCAITGWSRANARRQLTAARKPRRVGKKTRTPRARKYSDTCVQVLAKVWAWTGGMSGKYLAVSMRLTLDLLESHGECVIDQSGYSTGVRQELLSMSAATMDRYLAPARRKNTLRGFAATTAGPLLRNSITVRRAGDEVEGVPGFFEGDTVAHYRPVLKGEFARTLNLTDMLTSWVHTRSMRNNAHVHIRVALDRAIEAIPFKVTGLDFDNGSEFINHDVIGWARDLDIYFTRSRPYKKNDQATIESKNNHLVRRYGFYWRYDTKETLVLLNELWPLVNDRLNYLTPTKKPIGWATTSDGRRSRVYDTPRTPLDRLIASGILTPEKEAELLAYRNSLGPAAIARDIDRIQQQLTLHAAEITRTLEAVELAKQPNAHTGIRPAKRSAS